MVWDGGSEPPVVPTRWALRRKTYFPVLGLRRRLVETLIAAEPPDGMVQDGG